MTMGMAFGGNIDQNNKQKPLRGYIGGVADDGSPAYTIKTPEDFLKVPVDRLDACLADLREVLLMLHGMKKGMGEIELSDLVWVDDHKSGGVVLFQKETESQS